MDACRKGIPNGVSPFGLLRSPQTGDRLLCEHWACRELIGCAVGCLDRQRFPAGGHQLHRNGHQRSGTGSPPARTAPCGSRTTTTPSGASRRQGPSPTTPERASAVRRGSPPDRTAPCGSPTRANNSIGRITTAGAVTNYTGTGISYPVRDHRRAGRRLVVHELWKQLHRAHHDGRGRHQLHRNGHQQPGRDHGRAGRRLVVHEPPVTTPSGASRRQGSSPTTPERASAVRTGSPPGRTAPCGSRTSTTPSGASRRQGPSPTTPERASTVRTGSPPVRTAPCGSRTPGTTPSGASRRQGPSPTTPERASAIRTGIAAGPDGALWFTNSEDNSIGRITTGSTPPPTTSVLFPSNGATLSGSTLLDASATNATSVEFRLFGGSYGLNAPVICTATPTYYGWLCSWNTTTVPNGSYFLASEAFGAGGSAFSSGVSVTVSNPPPRACSFLRMGRPCPDRPSLMPRPRTPPASSSGSSAAATA